jgi:serpin B
MDNRIRWTKITLVAGLTVAAFSSVPAAWASPETESVVAANNQFALDLYGNLKERAGNLFFSPYCINKTLAMVYAGARGDTEKEMAAALHFTLGQERQHRAFRDMRDLLNAGHGILANPFRTKEPELYMAAGLWGQRGAGFDNNYLNLIRDCYGAGLQEVDFRDSERVRKQINTWVEDQTRNKIQNLFQPSSLDASTRLVLASAIYFKGDWTHPFLKSDTRDGDFSITPTDKKTVKLMYQASDFGYFEDGDCQVLRMPYQGDRHALVVLLPKKTDGLPELEKKLTAKRLGEAMKGLTDQKVRVWLPKLKMTQEFTLNNALSDLGMRQAFSPSADFRGMNGGNEPLKINEVIHKAFVDVNEEGTEAAAATGVTMNVLSAAPRPEPVIPVFRADHPFAFAICDVRTGLILFLGRVEQP